jgi:N-methylhydantoinase A
MERYLRRVHDELGDLKDKPFLVMQSSGGVASAAEVVRKPITTALSGPAAGALGSAVISEMAGFPNIVTLDAGGTSTDLCLIEGGKPHVTNGGAVGSFPVRIPMIDIETIGTGGGSLAWLTRENHLKVGPKSAGADPGPMCYPKGGTEPTITDANLVLGRIPAALIGGGITLDVTRSRAGMAALAARLPGNMSVEQLAHGIIEIANWNQANAIRQMTIQRGIDPRAQYAGLHRTTQPRQSLGLWSARGRLAHRPDRHQGDAPGQRRPRHRCRHLCQSGARGH